MVSIPFQIKRGFGRIIQNPARKKSPAVSIPFQIKRGFGRKVALLWNGEEFTTALYTGNCTIHLTQDAKSPCIQVYEVQADHDIPDDEIEGALWGEYEKEVVQAFREEGLEGLREKIGEKEMKELLVEAERTILEDFFHSGEVYQEILENTLEVQKRIEAWRRR